MIITKALDDSQEEAVSFTKFYITKYTLEFHICSFKLFKDNQQITPSILNQAFLIFRLCNFS